MCQTEWNFDKNFQNFCVDIGGFTDFKSGFKISCPLEPATILKKDTIAGVFM